MNIQWFICGPRHGCRASQNESLLGDVPPGKFISIDFRAKIFELGLSVRRFLIAGFFVLPLLIGVQSLVHDAALAQGAPTNWSGPSAGVFGASGSSGQTVPGFHELRHPCYRRMAITT
jgi:hypothetical protein